MHILHGTWIPNENAAYFQSGHFCLWGETVEAGRQGPRVLALAPADLERLLGGELCLGRDPRQFRRQIETRHFLLPHANERQLPSPELARAADLELPDSETAVDLQSQPVSCYVVPRDVPAALKELHFLCEYRLANVRAGADLEFWYRISREIERVLAKDQYIPALKYRPVTDSASGRRKKSTAAFEIHPGWEIVSDDYENAIRRAQSRMPRLCAAGAEQPHNDTHLYQSDGLLRHFCECVLDDRIYEPALPAVFTRRIQNSLLDHCLQPHKTDKPRSGEWWLNFHQQWQRWRQTLVHGRESSRFQLCLQLVEAETDSGPWYLEFRAASTEDPSLRPSLADYWSNPDIQRMTGEHFGANFEKQLLLGLGYAARMYPPLWNGLNNDRPEGLTLSLEEAFAFLKEHAWVLQDAGFKVLIPAWWTPEGRQRAKLRLRVASPGSRASTAAGPGYFSMDALLRYRYELAIGGEPVSATEWERLVAAKSPLVRFRGQWLELDQDKMQRMLAFWQQHGREEGEISLGELLKRAAEGEDELDVSRDATLSTLLAALHDPAKLESVDDPPGLQGRLRDYQRRGVAWLGFLERLGLGGCLADDMGLGKTLQVLARLLGAGAEPAPTLLIAPTSVLGNWQREARRFAPELRVLVHYGSDRLGDPDAFKDVCQRQNMVVTSYALARRDAKLLQAMDWYRVVIDEAQNIKNPAAAQTKAILKLKARHRLALTGTPVENRLLDLWSVFNFINPGYLGSQTRFRKDFELPVQRDRNPAKTGVLKNLVQPFILRRVKTDKSIIKDLPDKVENRQYCNLTPEQASLYQAVVKDVEREIESVDGIQRRGLILATLMRLKQICNHPAQFLQDNSAFVPTRSHKLARLLEMLDEVIQEGESLLIFTQFTEIGQALEKLLRPRCRTFYLHGGTARARRERMIETFQDPDAEPSAFVLSLKAGGTGITLTRANHVFHFDRWWNPAVENQATDRAYRIGQSRNVFVHKFVTIGTLEERIDRMIDDKKAIADSIVGSDETWLTELDNEHFKALIRLNRDAVMGD
jgi:SNF2 family DNA or RNA helicase